MRGCYLLPNLPGTCWCQRAGLDAGFVRDKRERRAHYHGTTVQESSSATYAVTMQSWSGQVSLGGAQVRGPGRTRRQEGTDSDDPFLASFISDMWPTTMAWKQASPGYWELLHM